MCDLYSPRLKAWFDDACATNDLQTLRNRIRERGAKFVEMRGKMEGLKMQYEQAKMQAEYHFGMMNIRQSSAMTQSLSWSVAGWSAPVSLCSSFFFSAGSLWESKGADLLCRLIIAVQMRRCRTPGRRSCRPI